MDILGKIISDIKEQGLSAEEIGIMDTMRSLERFVYDKKGVTTDKYSYIVLAPVYDEGGRPIQGVKEVYCFIASDSNN